MVRSRSETKLNDIFLDLCISPKNRVKNGHAHSYAPLPPLKPIRSNSCSDLTQSVRDAIQTPLTNNTKAVEDTDTLDLTSTFYTTLHERKNPEERPRLQSTPLAPLESTGFTLQPPTFGMNRSVSLFGSPPRSTLQSSTTRPYASIDREFSLCDDPFHEETAADALPSPTSSDWNPPDYTHRLSDRMRSRAHLRKFFLS